MNDEQFDQFRAELYFEAEAIAEEGQLVELLYRVERQAAEDLAEQFGEAEQLDDELDAETASRLLASVEAWASVSSHLTYMGYYGPIRELGAMKQKLIGWSRTVESKLQDLSSLLGGYLRKAMHALRASSFTIQAGFPWGVSVGLTWNA
jgi:hypothetical protein